MCVLSCLTCLTSLELDRYCDFAYVGMPESLMEVSLEQFGMITEYSLFDFCSLTCLTSLNLLSCQNIQGSCLGALEYATHLTNLKLPGCFSIDDNGLFSISTLTSLRELDLSNCHEITDFGLIALSNATGLTHLVLSGCFKITDEGLFSLGTLSSINSLEVCDCRNIEGTGFEAFSAASGLRTNKFEWKPKYLRRRTLLS